MTDDPLVPGVYAEALLSVVRKRSIELQDALRDAEMLGFVLESRDDLRAFLEGPHIPTEDKHKLVTSVFENRIPDYFYNLIRVCIDKDRTFYLVAILVEFVNQIELELGIHPVRIRTATLIDEELQKQVQSALEDYTGLHFRPRFSVDAKLIGGIVIQYEDTLIDMSLRGHLDHIRQSLAQVAKTVTV